MNIEAFFFLRPQWLILIIIFFAVFAILLRRSKHGQGGDWKGLIDAHLLKHLSIANEGPHIHRVLLASFVCAMVASIIALAGPTWEKNEIPTFKSNQPVVLVLSLAQAMNARDITPSRLTRATHKINDILKKYQGNEIGLVIYSDRPFVASPITSDSRIIKDMLPELTPDLMPVLGNRLDLAINEASDVLTRTGAKTGKIVILANDSGDRPQQSMTAVKLAASKGYTVDVLGIGTPKGSELITASGQIIEDSNNNPIITALDNAALSSIAKAGQGQFVKLTADSVDVDLLFSNETVHDAVESRVENGKPADEWNDVGYWLLFIPVLLAPLAFRRGLLMCVPMLVVIGLSFQSPSAQASKWLDWWKTPDQQAEQAFNNQDYSKAAQTFQNPNWKASALYKAGDYDKSASVYKELNTQDRDYNFGNALAKAGKFEQAIDAYDAALEKTPHDEDAKFNRDLVKQLLEQQQKQEQEQEQEQSNQNTDESEKSDSANQSDQGQDDSQEGSDQPSDQQNSSSNELAKQDDKNQQASNNQQQNTQEQTGQNADSSAQQEKSNSNTQENSSAQNSDDLNNESQPQSQHSDSQSQRSTSENKPKDKTSNQTEPSNSSEQEMTQSDKSQPKNSQADSQQPEAESKNLKHLLKKTMDEIFQGNTDDKQQNAENTPAESKGLSSQNSVLNQSAEQLLRSVPDNSSGLLKARIRQHYRQLREAYNNG